MKKLILYLFLPIMIIWGLTVLLLIMYTNFHYIEWNYPYATIGATFLAGVLYAISVAELASYVDFYGKKIVDFLF